MADALRSDLPGIARYRRLSGVDSPDQTQSFGQRFVRSKWLWTSVVLVLVYIASLAREYAILAPDREIEPGVIVPGLNNDALWQSAKYAAPTLLVWSAIFILVDRWRPQRWLLWFLAVGWGAAVSTYGSLVVNSWAADHLAIGDDNGNQLSGARAAIYIAPFVEEAFKGTVLFLVAFLDRGRLASKLNTMALAGLAAAGFAFTENIVYYARAIVYGSHTQGVGDVTKAVEQLVDLRGLYTSFGHPVFTSMIGLGVAIGLASRSKLVRVVAPVVGYLFAALLHMAFNTAASIIPFSQQLLIYFTVVLPMLVVALGMVIFAVIRQGRLIRLRLSDYVRMGWLPPAYPRRFSRQLRRLQLIVMSLWWGNVVSTILLIRAVTQLAYLRDGITRGVVDASGLWRERELLARISQLKARNALDDATGLRPYLRRKPKRPVQNWNPPNYPGPAGMGGQMPAPNGPVMASAPAYSTVDPRWAPPRP